MSTEAPDPASISQTPPKEFSGDPQHVAGPQTIQPTKGNPMTEEVSHTKGPWTFKHGKTNLFGVRNDTGNFGSVASTGGHESNQVDCGPENEANAKLIASAPELKAENEALRDYLESARNKDHAKTELIGELIEALEMVRPLVFRADTASETNYWKGSCDKIDATLAKAKGETE